MTPRAGRPRFAQAGFVLIGVVIFVLALTIIGLSLYSLSIYEAQFFQRSLDGEQAFQSALGGIERAKFALCQTSRLDSVTTYPRDENVTAARAIQTKPGGPDSTGIVNWVPGQTVLIRVTATVSGQQRTVESQFDPGLTQDYYSQLVTVGSGIEVIPTGAAPPTSRVGTVLLDGTVWEGSGQNVSTWVPTLAAPPDSVQTSPAVPVPSADDFITQHYGATVPAWSNGATPPVYRLDAGPTGVGYFRAPEPLPPSAPSSPNFSLRETFAGDTEIQVQGMAVWLFPHGVQFDYRPVISGLGSTSDDCLIIVAGQTGPTPSPDDPTAGIWLDGGIVADIPVILVSSAKVLVWHWNNHAGGESFSRANDLGVFARSLSLMGPDVGVGGTVALHRSPSGLLDSYFLGQLASYGALPNITSASGHRLTLLAGTWHASGQ